MQEQKQADDLNIAPLISDHKLKVLKLRVLSTILGYPFASEHNTDSESEELAGQCSCQCSPTFNYFIGPTVLILISLLMPELQHYPIAIGVSMFSIVASTIIQDCLLKRSIKIKLFVLLFVISFLWSTHFSVLNFVISDPSIYAASIILSSVSVFTSLLTLRDWPIKQFSASTLNYQSFGFHSTYAMRTLVCIPPLAVETILFFIYYAGKAPFSSQSSEPFLRDEITSPLLTYLNLGISLSFLTWSFGWISSFYNTLMFVINNILNGLIFCDELFGQWSVSILLLVLNCCAIGVSSVLQTEQSAGELKVIVFGSKVITFLYWMAWSTSMFVALIVFIVRKCQSVNNNNSYTRIGVCFMMQVIIAVGLYCLYIFLLVQNTEIDLNAVLRVAFPLNIALYATSQIFTQLRSPRISFGCLGCMSLSARTEATISIIQRYILRTSSSALILFISVVFTSNNSALTIAQQIIGGSGTGSSIVKEYQLSFVMNVIVPVIFYRSFKKCLSTAKSHSLHLSIVISYLLYLLTPQKTSIVASSYAYEGHAWLYVLLFMPPLPHNFFMVLLTPFTIPKKLQHNNQNCYRIIYVVITSLAGLVFLFTLGLFELTMIFGLPVFWCVLPSTNYSTKARCEQKDTQTNARTPQETLYRKIIKQLPMHIYRGKQPGFYLFRISKYLMLLEVTNQCYGLYEIVEFRGLEAQQITTCHAKEGQTVDRVISEVWDNDQNNRQRWACADSLTTAIWPVQQIPSVMVSVQNEIKLTGIIESEQFYQLFKKCLIKGVIYYYQKSLIQTQSMHQEHKNALITQINQKGQQMCADLHSVIRKQQCEEIFPYEFAQQLNLQVRYPTIDATNSMTGPRKLPPISMNANPKKREKQKAMDEFLDLIGETSEQNITDMKQAEAKDDKNKDNNNQQNSLNHSQTNFSKQEINMAAILTIHCSILGKVNYLQLQRLCSILKKQSESLSQLSYPNHQTISANAVGSAFKIAVSKYLQGETQVTLQDFNAYHRDEYCGVLQSKQFAAAVAQDKGDIWTVNYHAMKRIMTVKRIASVETPLYVLGINWHIVKAVWNNLRFELLFAANDDDERYSIQTHEYLLRNLLVQACEQPYGYAGYYADNIHIV